MVLFKCIPNTCRRQRYLNVGSRTQESLSQSLNMYTMLRRRVIILFILANFAFSIICCWFVLYLTQHSTTILLTWATLYCPSLQFSPLSVAQNGSQCVTAFKPCAINHFRKSDRRANAPTGSTLVDRCNTPQPTPLLRPNPWHAQRARPSLLAMFSLPRTKQQRYTNAPSIRKPVHKICQPPATVCNTAPAYCTACHCMVSV